MSELLDALAKYVIVLNRSAQETHRAEDRQSYTQHMAAAAALFVAAHTGRLEELRELVASERHAYGWGYLSYAEGDAAEKAFARAALIARYYHDQTVYRRTACPFVAPNMRQLTAAASR